MQECRPPPPVPYGPSAASAVVLSSVTASVVGRGVFGGAAFLHLPAFQVRHPAEYLLYAVLGLAAGAVGFTRGLYLVEDVCDRAWRGPEWLRPAAGGDHRALVGWITHQSVLGALRPAPPGRPV
jgi:H+/Cl- antiporter ClcA